MGPSYETGEAEAYAPEQLGRRLIGDQTSGEVPRVLGNMEHLEGTLQKKLDMLHEKLAPVLGAGSPNKSGLTDRAIPEYSSPMAQALQAHETRLTALIERVDYLSERIEL